MRQFRRFVNRGSGVERPLTGPLAPTLLGLGLLAALSAGCNSQDQQQSLPVVQVGMINDPKKLPPIFDDGELQIFEVKKGVQFPILAPTPKTMGELNKIKAEPYGRQPWVTTDDVEVQVTWTITNLDDTQHVVELLVDPWNEFGRYYPGMQLTNPDEQKYMPNFSGIDKRYIVGAKSTGDASRAHGTYTFSDLQEMATDFATVMNLIKNPPTAMDAGAGDGDNKEDPTVIYTNHAFEWQNRSYDDPLVKGWIPSTVAALTGVDLGFRTYEPAAIGIEVELEVVDKSPDLDRVRPKDDNSSALLAPTDKIVTVGVVPP